MDPSSLRLIARLARALAGPAADAPDAELLARFAGHRDEAAFAALVYRHGPMVWAACRHLLPAPADAEDAFQATFLALARSADRVRGPAGAGGWLHAVAVRAAGQLRRSAGRRRRREAAAAGPEGERPVPDSAWDALLAAVHEEADRLPAGLRSAFILCDLEGVSQPAAAVRLGLKPGTLTARLTRARQRLVGQLTRRGLAPGAGLGVVVTAAAGGAVPPALVRTAVRLAHDPSGASAAVAGLVKGVLAMTLIRVKLAAAVVVAGGLGLSVGGGWLAGAGAQPGPPGPTVPPVSREAQPSAAAPKAGDYFTIYGNPTPAKWEFRYQTSKFNPFVTVTEIEVAAGELSADGWEFAGTAHLRYATADERKVIVAPPHLLKWLDPPGSNQPAAGLDVMVFKRPKAQSAGVGGQPADPVAAGLPTLRARLETLNRTADQYEKISSLYKTVGSGVPAKEALEVAATVVGLNVEIARVREAIQRAEAAAATERAALTPTAISGPVAGEPAPTDIQVARLAELRLRWLASEREIQVRQNTRNESEQETLRLETRNQALPPKAGSLEARRLEWAYENVRRAHQRLTEAKENRHQLEFEVADLEAAISSGRDRRRAAESSGREPKPVPADKK